MKAIHFKCVRVGIGWRNLTNSEDGTYCSGFWDLSEDDAKSLIGGWIYLHETKADRSGFGGRILAYQTETLKQFARSNRISFRFRPSKDARNQPGRGQNDTMAWTGRSVEADSEHEKHA